MTRLYSSTSVETTLATGISNSATSMTVAAGTGTALLGGVTITSGDQFTVAIDPDTTNEEIVFITVSATDTFTIDRAEAGTSAVAHSAGATVKHVLTSDDLTYFNTYLPATLITAKGDLVAGSAPNIATRLGIGNNGDYLQVDSTQSTGIKWTALTTDSSTQISFQVFG